MTLFSRTPPPFDPAWPAFARQAVAYGAAVRTPKRVAYEPDQVGAILSRVGFRRVEAHTEVCHAVLRSEEEWWGFLRTLGSRATILGMDPPTRARFREECLVRVRPFFRQDGLHLSLGVVHALAQRQAKEQRF